jgi:hypothetical protein
VSLVLEEFPRQLDQQEDRLAALHTEIDGLRAKRERASAELDTMIEQIDYRSPGTKPGQ